MTTWLPIHFKWYRNEVRKAFEVEYKPNWGVHIIRKKDKRLDNMTRKQHDD